MKFKVPVITTVYEEREIPDEWKKCCRCFPNSVSQAGYCGCCDFDHVKGERMNFKDTDMDDPYPPPSEDKTE